MMHCFRYLYSETRTYQSLVNVKHVEEHLVMAAFMVTEEKPEHNIQNREKPTEHY